MNLTEQLRAALAGRYEIERLIGSGGMATVYLARDIKHHRRVALKLLNPELGVVLGPERFLSEIQVTANLQHPNLLPLFDSGEAGGLLFYVMPYIEGETLRQRLERERQLPVDEAVRIGRAVASALDYAHRRGVIHRDLKPENILMHEGQPLVMDFGIALAVSNAGGARVTQTGLSLGTPQYMSPEQATGDRQLDARTDIYSLGAVCYEMLSGDPPHTGSTVQAVIAKVLTERPRSLRSSRETIPEHVDGAVMFALAKLPADRFVTAAEFGEALAGTRPVPVLARADAVLHGSMVRDLRERPRTSRSRIREVAAWTLALSGIAAAVVLATRPDPLPVSGRFVVTLPESVVVASGAGGGSRLALSRDGMQLVVVGTKGTGRVGRALYLRRVDDPVARLVRGSDSAASPTFSPDGRWLLYHVGGALKKVPTEGGTPQVLADSQAGFGSWGDQGQIVYLARGGRGLGEGGGRGRQGRGVRGRPSFSEAVPPGLGSGVALGGISSDGGDRRPLARIDSLSGILRIALPEVLPGGRHAIITLWKGGMALGNAKLGIVSLEDGKITELGIAGTNPHYVSTGHIMYGRDGGLVFARPFTLRTLKATGPEVLLLENVWMGAGGAVDFSVAENGVMAFRGGSSGDAGALKLYAVDRSGVERELTKVPQSFRHPRVSPDGNRVVVQIGSDLWIFDVATGALSRLTTDSASSLGEWTRDGSRVVYVNERPPAGRGDRGGGNSPNPPPAGTAIAFNPDSAFLMSRPWDGSGGAIVLARRPRAGIADLSLGPAGGFSAIRSGRNHADVMLAPTDSLGSLRPLVATAAAEGMPRVSPNGRLLAYTSDEGGQMEVFLRAIPGPGPRVPVSIGGGNEPIWSPDGATLYYRGPSRLMTAAVTERPSLAVTRRDSLFLFSYRSSNTDPSYDVFPNGREFLMIRGEVVPPSEDVYVIMNWQLMLQKRSGTVGDPP